MKKSLMLILSAALVTTATSALAQGTTFAYQGRLQNNGAPANGNYDFMFTLYATNVNGLAVAGPLTNSATPVSNGLFSVTIDFGTGVFNGSNYWLDVSVSPAGSNTFTDLTPRQPILPTPYAILANSANYLLGALPASQLNGTIPMAQLPSAIVTNADTGVTLSGTFSGSGSGLTGLNPANLSAGTAVINISGNAATATTATNAMKATAANTATLASNVVSGINITNAFITNSVFAGTFNGNGGSLTNLNPTKLSAGTAAISISGNAATATTATNAITAASATTSVTAGAAATATLASNVVSGIHVTNAIITNSVFAGTFSGNGGSLTNLNPANLSVGTAAISISGNAATATYATTAGAALSMLASNVVAGIHVTNAVITNSTFAGNGGGLTNLPAAGISASGSTAGQVLTSTGSATAWANANPWLGGVPTLVTNGTLSTNAFLTGRDRSFFLGFITSAATQGTYSNYFTIKLSQAVSTNAVMVTFAPARWGSWTNSGSADSTGAFGGGAFQFVTTSNSVTVQSAARNPDSSVSFGIFVHVDQP